MNRTAQSVGSLGIGGAIAALVLFGLRIYAPELHMEMGDLEKQAVGVIVIGLVQRGWSVFGPKGEA